MRWLGLLFILFVVSSSLWEYGVPSVSYEKAPPETYLSLIVNDTIYAHVDSLTGEITCPIGSEPL